LVSSVRLSASGISSLSASSARTVPSATTTDASLAMCPLSRSTANGRGYRSGEQDRDRKTHRPDRATARGGAIG
jgi:hypothetical protein